MKAVFFLSLTIVNSGPRISIAEKNASYFLAQTNFFVFTVQRYIQTSQAKRELQLVFRQEYHFKVLLYEADANRRSSHYCRVTFLPNIISNEFAIDTATLKRLDSSRTPQYLIAFN